MNKCNCFYRLMLAGLAMLCLSQPGVFAQSIISARAVSPPVSSPYSTQNTSQSLKSILEDLKSKRGVYYMFNGNHLQDKRVEINFDPSAKIETILAEILQPLGLTYTKVGEIYVIVDEKDKEVRKEVRRKIDKLITNPSLGQGNTTFLIPDQLPALTNASQKPVALSVTGQVVNELGEPLPGVSVLVKGTTIGTTTDGEGKYILTVPDQQADGTLVFSFIGYLSEEIKIGNQTTINIGLVPNLQTLSEVVVVGYGTQKRTEVTSAIATVKAEDFNAGGTRSPLDLIQGKVAGLTITRTQGNNPNSSPSIQLRGVTSIEGGNSPLIVIDGIPGGNLDLLQQDDIESMDVLKDGSAAAIYGTRANNGVILITTKKGKEGPARFDYSTYIQREAVAKKPEFLSAGEYRALMNDPNNTKAGQMRDYGYSTDFYDELINKANLSQYHNLALSGGTSKTNYRASLYYNNADPITWQNSRRQFGGRLSLNQTGFNDRLQVQLNLATNFNRANLLGGNTGDFESALTRNPTLPVFNEDGTYYEDPQTTNPVARLHQESNKRSQQTTSADAKFTLDIYKGLRASVFGAIQRDTQNDNEYKLQASRSSQRGSSGNSDNTDFGSITPKGTGYARKYNSLNTLTTLEPTIEYSGRIATSHSINAIAGYSYQYNVTERFEAANAGFINDIFEENNLGAGNFIQGGTIGKAAIGSRKEDNTLIAFFGRVNYVFNEKYLASFILRHEGSSRFGNNNKWGDFPAVSAGWVISKENFMQSLKVIDILKLRAGYGVTGSQNIPNYRSLVLLSTGNFYLNPDGTWKQTYGPSNNPNPNLRWEKKKEFNIGVDFGVLNNRITGAVDVYKRRTEDLLGSYSTQQPPYILPDLYTNVGTIENKGIELLVSAVPVQKKDFTWSMDFTANTQRNKLVSFSNDIYKVSYRTFGGIGGFGALGDAIRTVEGGPLGSFYGNKFAGFDDAGKWLFYKKDGSVAKTTEITNDDKFVIGNGVPKYMASWSNTFRYKNFDLTVFFRGKFGYDILNTQQIGFAIKLNLPNNILKSALTTHKQLDDTYQYSDYFLEKGDFVKLDNVTLGYNLKFNNPYLRNLRVYVTGRNLVIMTGYSGLDPEINDTGLAPGIDGRGFYPRTRSYTLGLQVGF